MPKELGQQFFRERLKLTSGGVFDFDAVNADRSIVANISTSSSRMSSGKPAVGKMMKIRSDIYFLLLVDAKRRLVVLTEKDMYDQCLGEARNGRVPASIEFHYAELPEHLASSLKVAKQSASDEVRPQ